MPISFPSPKVPLAHAKSNRRRRLRARRRSRSITEIENAGIGIAAHASAHLPEARVIAAFVSTPSEPDTAPLLRLLAQRGSEIRIPAFGAGVAHTWARYTPGDVLQAGAPGRPPMPQGPFLPPESIAEAELILVPALAVDTHGTRLGQGGGWYDRALTLKRPGTPVYGVVFSEEFTAMALPRAAHDHPLDGVLTPDGFTALPTT